MKTRVAIFSFIAAGFLFASNAFSCPCHPCKCSPCTCGGMGSKSGGGGGKHHGDHHHGHDHGGGASVGVGVDVDLSSVGHRTREADPFASGGNDKPVAHTEEKRTTKKKEREPTTNSFDEIKLTGRESKDENAPNTFNVNNDEPPKTTDAATELKKAYDKYHSTLSDWLKKQPNYGKLMHDWTQSPNTEEGNKKSAKAKKKIDKLFDQFQKGDGKDLVDDWKKAFDSVLKSGGTVDDNAMVPPPADDIEKKKYAVIKAQNDLKWAQKMFDDKKQNESNKDEEVKKAQNSLSDFKTTNDPGYKGAVADLEKAIEKAGQKWAGTDEGKAETKKLHDAEKELDKAKDAWKPFEKYEEKKAAANE